MNTERINIGRLNKILIAISLVSLLMFLGKLFLVPVAIAAFFAMLLFPITLTLHRRGLSQSFAALCAIGMLLITLGFLGVIINYQISALQEDLPELEVKLEEKTHRLQWLLSQTTDITTKEQDNIIEEKKPDIVKAMYKVLKNVTVQSLFLLLQTFIVLTYTFFFLIYQHKIQTFFVRLKLFNNQKESKILLARISRVAHDYLKGTIMVISLLGIIYALGFWAIGLEHALLFAVITALLRVVPYFGSFLGIAFPIAFAILTKDSFWYPVIVVLFFMVTQLLEANFLTPYITGSRVKLNPLATIMIILLGNLLWGVPGMILFVPLFGILKVIFDEIPALQPYGYILGKEE
ncbi:AI-2E family transporter [Adhaeribacter aquaticus]|uniref:AI-2E family transporter n=1 Tax=Adhaeribacter aquaticus TaxID=299567 RepID=UPI0004200F0B|nr:AI-2E family transporter [Adhaeribacter aquaticus]